MARRERIVVTTHGPDPGRAFVGGPYPGDIGNVGLVIPRAGTVSRTTRYLYVLGSVCVPARCRGWLVGYKQLLTISTGEMPYWEEQVTGPIWAFPDGDVLWFLRTVGVGQDPGPMPQLITPGQTPNIYTREPALLSTTNPPAAYVPPSAGIPPGEGVPGLDCVRGIVYPYGEPPHAPNLEIELPSPCEIIAYASVWQPPYQPAGGRPRPAVVPSPPYEGLCKENAFYLAYPDAGYHRIGVEMTIEIELKEQDICGEQVCSER